MKLVIALMKHETNTFSPLPTPLAAFGPTGDGPVYGQAIAATYAGTNNAIAAFLDFAKAERATAVTPIAASAVPSGPVARDAFEHIAGAIVDAAGAGCDAILLDLHGAMAVEGCDDGEGELLRRIRAVAPKTPIGVALDFHTNLSAAMVEHATAIAGYRTYPHIDVYDTGARVARTIARALRGEARPVMAWGRRPILSHTLRHSPSREPMKSIMDRANAAEDTGAVLNATVFGAFALADIPLAGMTAVVVADGDKAKAQALVDALLDEAWAKREGFIYKGEPMAATIARAKSLEGGPIILADHADNCFSGGTQDVMAVLAECMRQGLSDLVAGPFRDPAAVAELIAAGVGAQVTVELGGKTDMPSIGAKGKPLRLSGTVRCITDGSWTITAPMMTGMRMSIGRTVVLDTGAMQIMASERPVDPFDIGNYTHAGIDPTKKRFILLKSRQHFRAGLEPIAKHILEVDGPGVTTSDYGLLKFVHTPRPIYPLDPEMEYRPVGASFGRGATNPLP
jgi:microcystin degradation protein MlrC